ncbi:MAG: DUF1513 domain-containing protein [Bdellovibrionales bacterium]|nr:DUF1513 domain-containing protein [Bdellovibrionales bacterium]
MYRIGLDSMKTESIPVDLNLAHFVYAPPQSHGLCYVIEQNGSKVLEVDCRAMKERRSFTLSKDHLLYGHAVYHRKMNALLLTASDLNDGKDSLHALDLNTWSIQKSYDLGTRGEIPHDIVLADGEESALVITLGLAKEDGQRYGGKISMLDLQSGAISRQWKTDDNHGAPQHFSRWRSKDSIYFTMIRQKKKIPGQSIPAQLRSTDRDEFFKRTAANFEYENSSFARLSLTSKSIEYFEPATPDRRMRRPLNIFWSEIPSLSRYVVVDHIRDPGVWVWDGGSVLAHRTFEGDLSCACLLADNKSVLAITSAGKGYVLEIPSLDVKKEFDTLIPPAPHPLLIGT